jgi:hypothetical protein
MDNITAAYIVPGLNVKSYAGLPVDILSTAIGHLRLQFPDYLLADLVDNMEDGEDLVISVVVETRPHD